MSFQRILIAVSFLLCASIAKADYYFHNVPAKKGDNIYSLLSRYHLEEHRCNYTQFYLLNKLNEESILTEGQSYMLPVMIYKYNGKSIRSTLKIDSWAIAIQLKEYNELILQEKLRKKSIVDSRILWVPYHQMYCAEDFISKTEQTVIDQPFETTNNVVKPPSGERQFPIFGSKYSYVPLKDNSLRGKVYYIVAGHGGPDPGAVGKRNGKLLCEDEYAYDVALRLTRNLVERGATAYMITRDPNDGIRDEEYLSNDKDEYCWGNMKLPWNQKRRLFQRSDAVNRLVEKHSKQGITDQTLLSIHIDSRSKGQKTDVFFYFFPGSKAGQDLALNMQQTFRDKYNKYRPGRNYYGTVTARDLHMLRETKSNSVYIELGNIANPNDQQRFIYKSNRQALADWLYDGLVSYQ